MPYYLRVWHWLVGSNKEFPLTMRIFHSICLIVLAALAYNIPFNYLVGLHSIALLSAISLVLFGITYYLSRYKSQSPLALLIFSVCGLSLFLINFFLNSGIDGPTDLFFVLTMVVMIAIIPVRYYWTLVAVNITIVVALHYLQFAHPELVPFTYMNRASRFVDITSSYAVVVGMILFNFYFIRRNYETEKRSAEQKTAMMTVLNEEKNKLFSIISHDLRAPLSNVQSYLELLTQVELSDKERMEIKKDLLMATRSTLDMLNNVLSWSKNQMQGLKFTLSPVYLHQSLLPQLLLFTNIAANKKIKVEVMIDHDLQVLANGDMLQLIARNLINNAIKFTSAGGRIIVSVRKEGDYCQLMVKDSGNGHPIQLSNQIFYLKGTSTRGTSNEKGVGLGLVLCKEFTEAQNGKIWFECDSVSGTTFFVELPMAKPSAGSKALGLQDTAEPVSLD